jgi:hypothetical protein
MIRFDRLEADGDALAESFAGASPFRLVVLDDFVDPGRLADLMSELPDPETAGINKSRDAVFAKNKYEKSGFQELGPACKELFDELCSDRFAAWLGVLTRDPEVFVDTAFHGGGLHQGGPDSFLDMHVDFNKHPIHPEWSRDLNILLYLNEGWEPSWRGELKLRHRATGASTEIEPRLNRCVIMETRDFTLHGYDRISFPAGRYRKSIACYAYTPARDDEAARVTVWYPESHNAAKRILGRSWPHLVRVKNRVFGSATAKNR